MADPNRFNDLFKLPPEMEKTLQENKAKSKAAKTALAALKTLGIPTADVEADLDTAMRVIDTMLERFGNQKKIAGK